MRVLALTKGTEQVGSSRLRIYEVFGRLGAAGIQAVMFPYDRAWTTLRRESGARTHPACRVIAALYKHAGVERRHRLRQLRRLVHRAKPGDMVVIQKVRVPDDALAQLRARGATLVYDVDDLTEWMKRALLGADPEGDSYLKNFHLVVAGNPTLAKVCTSFGGNVVVIPTAVDVGTYRPIEQGTVDKAVVGWTGSAEGAVFLLECADSLTRLARNGVCKVAMIGGKPEIAARYGFEHLYWSEDVEANEVPRWQAGLAPLEDSLHCACKCGYKALVYMACGVPVVGTEVGVHKEIIQDGINGYLVRTAEEWHERLQLLCANAEMGRRLGRAGRSMVERWYSMEAAAQKWLDAMRELKSLRMNGQRA